MESSRRFGIAIAVGILSSWPLGYFGVLLYLLWRPLLDSDYTQSYAIAGGFSALGVAALAVLFLGMPLYLVGERRSWLNPPRFIAIGAIVALCIYCVVFWGIGGREALEISVQAMITTIIGGCVGAVILLIAPLTKS